MKKRLKAPAIITTTFIPKVDPRKIALTRLLTERVDSLRHEFIGNRLNRKSALVKEQMQTQRMKQQQLILKQQQAIAVKKKESSSEEEEEEEKKPITPPPPVPVKKAKKTPKRTRPLPPTVSNDQPPPPPPKKPRRSRVTPPTEQRESSDNDENLLNHRKSSFINIPKMKSTEKSKKIITIKNSSNRTEINLSDINCSCQRTDLPDKFFIQCELCSRWLHGNCVGLTPRLAEKMKEFICEDCTLLTQKAKERLYCICQKPYDESQ